MKLHELLTEDVILSDLKYQDRENVLKEMVGFLKKKNKIKNDKELYEKLIQRENLGSTAIGEGVAIPHCKIRGIKGSEVILAISRKGVDFYSLDKKPTHILFLVISSPDNLSLNLQILATIAHLVRKSKDLVKKILAADDVKQILDVVRIEEEKLNG
ncbi:MAG: PTS sugar transporter subunit IIA [Elusimicrobiota bacterium]